MNQSEKSKLTSLYQEYTKERYQNTYYSYNVHQKQVMYLNGDVRKFGSRIVSL